MKIRLLFLAFCLVCGASSQAQSDESSLRLVIIPGDYSLKVNGVERPATGLTAVTPGINRLTIYREGYFLLDTLLTVSPGESMLMRHSLEMHPDFHRCHFGGLERTYMGIWYKGIIPAAVVGSAVVSGFQFKEAAFIKNRMTELHASYSSSNNPSEIFEYKIEYNSIRKNFNAHRVAAYSTAVLAGGLLAVNVRGMVKMKQRKPAPFIDDQKLKFDSVALLRDQSGGQTFTSVGLKLSWR